MSILSLAVFAEGRSDERFLPIIIQRTAEKIIAKRGHDTTDVLEPQVVPKPKDANGRDQCILAVARQTSGYHALIIHADADQRTAERALSERINPGVELARQAGINHHCIPLIPVRMTEAWLMADPEKLLETIGTNTTAAELNLPTHPHEVETISNPKASLNDILRQAKTRRRKAQVKIKDIYEPVARTMDLERLWSVPAYQQFVEDISQALVELHFIK